MNKWYIKIDISDCDRVVGILNEYRVCQFSKMIYNSESKILFAIYCTPDEQKAIVSKLNFASIAFEVV